MDASCLNPDLLAKIRRALARSWSERTSVCFNPNIAPLAYGQCAPTAVVVNELLGGEILKTEMLRWDGHPVRHFYNRVDGRRLDFTEEQLLEIPDYWSKVEYHDIPSSVAEAETEMLPGQLSAMRSAFKIAMEAEDAV